jgi:DNA invertase Pin-like site-specific DNA recombinase
MKAIILARVSTKEQEEKDHSNPAQVRRLKEYVLKK